MNLRIQTYGKEYDTRVLAVSDGIHTQKMQMFSKCSAKASMISQSSAMSSKTSSHKHEMNSTRLIRTEGTQGARKRDQVYLIC